MSRRPRLLSLFNRSSATAPRLPTACHSCEGGNCRRPNNGFLALDAMIAAVIAALVGAALLSAVLAASSYSRRAARDTQALVLAHLALAMDARKAAANGEASAIAADASFSSRIRAEPIDPESDPAAFRAYRMTVEVRDASGVASRLETVRAISLSERTQ